jgi:hypothetical protein
MTGQIVSLVISRSVTSAMGVTLPVGDRGVAGGN